MAGLARSAVAFDVVYQRDLFCHVHGKMNRPHMELLKKG
jgi:hypothetical protein